ncbi:MAG: polysaccharide deacetylase [Acidobacteria bacterium]|nr:polysaccharide deacetylase [Acidobacteriota bacterium]
MYHAFSPDTTGLKEQCEHIRRYYQPLSMKTISESLEAGRTLPHNNVAITIDDGYRDFFLYAYPVFRDYQINPTVCVISDFLDQRLWPWWNQIEYAFEHTAQKSVSLPFPDGETENLMLETQEQRLRAAKRTVDTLITVGNTDRLKLMSLIPKILEVAVPTSPPFKWSPLGWDEVRQMVRDGVEIAAHTKTHPILSRISDEGILCEEIEGSKRRIEEELDQPLIHFSYPNGKLADFTKQTVEVVKRCGFRTALTSERGLNSSSADRFLLRRIGVEPVGATPYFQELLAGIVDARGAKTRYSSLK